MNTPSTSLLLASAFGVSLLFTACASEPEDKQDRMQDKQENIQEDMQDVDMKDNESFEKDRQDILEDLRDLRSDINDDLSDSEKKLADTNIKTEDRTRHERLRTELTQQRQVVEEQIQKVENATMNTWTQVQTDTRRTLDDANMYYNKENMKRRRGDNVGANTNTTNDRNAVKVDGAVDINDKDNNAHTDDK
ncbi:MAG: hypothetical protein M3R08_01110 [Bacteroidota bacterium]|nr:hypothetical protein [Bacteroidota bacterium]